MTIITVKTGGIAADAVTDAKIADDVVGTEHLTANEVDTAALKADAVTAAEIADNAVNSEHYTDGSIDTAHLADGQVTIGKLATAVLTGATDIGAAIVDADLFLVDDGAGGTLRKTAASRLKTYTGGVNTPAFAVKLDGDQNISNDETFTKITFNSEDLDSDGKFASNRFTPTVAGWYNIQLQVFVQGSNAQMNIGLGAIYKNGSKVAEGRVDHRTNPGRGAGVHIGYVIYLDSDDYIEGFAANNHAGSNQSTIEAQPGTLMSGFRITGV